MKGVIDSEDQKPKVALRTEGFTEEVTFEESLKVRFKLANWIKEGRLFQVEGNFASLEVIVSFRKALAF